MKAVIFIENGNCGLVDVTDFSQEYDKDGTVPIRLEGFLSDDEVNRSKYKSKILEVIASGNFPL